jgi:excisionase family DNA binding protein
VVDVERGARRAAAHAPWRLNVAKRKSDPPESLFLTAAEAGRLLGVSGDHVYRLADSGDLPCVTLGRRRLIPRQAIDMLLERALGDFDPDRLINRPDDGGAA